MSLLLLSHFVVGVHQHDRLAVGPEREGGLVTGDTLVGERLEDLLEGRLCHTVLLDAKLTLLVLEPTEEPADRLVLLGNTQLKELTALFEDLDAIEVSRPRQVR